MPPIFLASQWATEKSEKKREKYSDVTENWPWKMHYSWLHSFRSLQSFKGERQMDVIFGLLLQPLPIQVLWLRTAHFSTKCSENKGLKMKTTKLLSCSVLINMVSLVLKFYSVQKEGKSVSTINTSRTEVPVGGKKSSSFNTSNL